jgi:hypothetical protein
MEKTDYWTREKIERALANGNMLAQSDGPITVEVAYPSNASPGKQIVILQPDGHEDQVRVLVSNEDRDKHFPDGAKWRMVLIKEE